MFSGYFFHKRALEIQRQTREIQRSLEELTIQRLVAERQLHDAKRLRYEAEYKLLALKAQRRRSLR